MHNIIDSNKNFTVCIYVCLEGLGGVLLQDNVVIASRKLKKHEQNYAIYDLDAQT